MGASEDGDGAPGSQRGAQGIGEQGRFGERADEDEIDRVRQFLEKILETRVAGEADLVTLGLAPDGDGLRHDAGEIRVHDPRVERAGRTLRDEVDNGYAELTHSLLVRPPGLAGWFAPPALALFPRRSKTTPLSTGTRAYRPFPPAGRG